MARDGLPSAPPAGVAVVRCCPGLDCPAVIAGIADRLPAGVLVEPEPGSASARWVVEVCVDGGIVTSELQDLVTGASDRRSVPLAAAVATGQDWPRRQAVNLVAAQIRAALDETTVARASEPAEQAGTEDRGGEAAPEAPALALTFFTSVAAAGNIVSARGDQGITLGPAFAVGILAQEAWAVEFGVAPTGVVSADGDAAVDVVPVGLAAGFDHDFGPLALGGTVGAVAEYWEPGGVVSASGWRWGVGLWGRGTLPVWRWLSVRLQAGVSFFPESVVFAYDRGERPGIVCELGSWRWQAGLGLLVSIPVLQESSP